MTLEEDKVQNNKNNPHNENSLLNDIFYILENKKCSESEGIQFPDSNLEVLQYLKESTQKRIIKENNKRKKIIYSLIKKY